LNSTGKRAAPPDAAIDEATVITDGADEPSLARDMIEVHGVEAATVARNNARAAALNGLETTGKVLDQGARADPKTASGQGDATPGAGRLASIRTGPKLNPRMTAMYISLANSREDGFKKWWDAHQPGNDDDTPGGATPIAITEPPCDDCDVIQEQPHYPWIVPGAGGSF
jgi:hypothetical protein